MSGHGHADVKGGAADGEQMQLGGLAAGGRDGRDGDLQGIDVVWWRGHVFLIKRVRRGIPEVE